MRRGLTVMVLALLLGVLAGCGKGGQSAAPPKMHPEASKVAVEFYHAYYLWQDLGKAWDLALPQVHNRGRMKPFSGREEFVQFWLDSKVTPKPDREYQIQEFNRVDDYLYLISDSQDRWLIWVTEVDGQWKVRRKEIYEGGEIDW